MGIVGSMPARERRSVLELQRSSAPASTEAECSPSLTISIEAYAASMSMCETTRRGELENASVSALHFAVDLQTSSRAYAAPTFPFPST